MIEKKIILCFVRVQIFEEEHNVWFLDKGGALVAVKQPSVPTRHLWYVHISLSFEIALHLICWAHLANHSTFSSCKNENLIPKSRFFSPVHLSLKANNPWAAF